MNSNSPTRRFPRRRRLLLVSLLAVLALLLLALLLFALFRHSLPAPRPSTANAAPRPPIPSVQPLAEALEEFSGDRALHHATTFAELGPKIPGTPRMDEIVDDLCQRLRMLELTPEVQSFQDATPSGPLLFRNILVRIPPADAPSPASPTPLLLLAAHYDTKAGIPDFMGANDSASGVGLLLELARVWRLHPLRQTEIRIAFLDGEECARQYGPHDGLHGSRHLAAAMQTSGELAQITAFLLVDMIGDADLTLTLPRNSTPALLDMAFQAARQEGIRHHLALYPTAILDDHVPFLQRGVPSLDLIDFHYGSAPGLNDYWHTAADTPDKLSAQSLTHVARLLLRLTDALDPPPAPLRR